MILRLSIAIYLALAWALAQNPSELRVLFDPLEDWQKGIKLVEELPQAALDL